MEISKYKLDIAKIEKVDIEEAKRHETVDITVECPKCGLKHTGYDIEDDDWHIIQCDSCGKKYKYKYN